jgi:hypothetical protein
MAIIIGSAVVAAYAFDEGTSDNGEGVPYAFRGMGRFGPRRMGRGGHFGFIEVSGEFEAKAISIAEGDDDVKDLLDDGYTVVEGIGVRPIIKTIVDGDGNVAAKATNAIIMLEKDGDSKAIVCVDMEAEQVMRIVVLTRTVIEKTSTSAQT